MTNLWETPQTMQVKEKTMTEEIVSFENLSLQLLNELFKSAYFILEPIEGNSFLVREGNLHIAVSIDDDRKRYIHFAYLNLLNENKNHTQRVEFSNRLNQKLIFVRATIESRDSSKEFIIFEYYLCVEGGVTKHNIVSAFKQFAETVRSAFSLDTEGIF